MQKYLPPEGFTYDARTNLYYKSDMITDENAQQVLWVTWFNTETGEYSQYSYPQTAASTAKESQDTANTCIVASTSEVSNERVSDFAIEAEQEESKQLQPITYMAPENYSFHKDSGLYYNLVVTENDKGDWVDFVTWFDTKTGEYAQVEYLHIAKKTIEENHFKTNYKTVRRITALILILALGVSVWHFKPYEYLQLSFGKDLKSIDAPFKKENLETDLEEHSMENTPDKDQPSNDKHMAEVVLTKESLVLDKNEDTSEDQSAYKSSSQDQDDFGPQFGHASLYYMLADEDEDYVYALHQSYADWKFVMDGICGDLYRIPKNQDNGVAEIILDIAGPENEIAAFAVLGDAIYFSINLHHVESGVNQFGYYKIPKAGGNAQYLFTDEGSFMRSYKGKVYFLFRERNELCTYDPFSNHRHYEALNLSAMYDVMSGGARSEFTLFMPFSIYDECVYLGGMYDYNYYYGKYHLESKKITPIIHGDLSFALESDEGGVAIYGVNPILRESNGNVMNSDPNGILAKTSEDIFVTYKTINNKYSFERFYFENNTLRKEPLPNINYQNETFAYGAVRDWILFNDSAISIKSGKIESTISLNNFKDLTANWNLDAANELINKYNESDY